MITKQKLSGIIKKIVANFDLRADLLAQENAEEEIRSGVSFRGSQLLVLIFAIIIASVGLNTNSIPVIIGAMLISPLMGPIIGIGLSIGIQDFSLLKQSLKNITLAILGSIVASALYFSVSPIYEGSSQLLARTTPSIYDVIVALFGGAAGIISIACKNKGNVLPGVAIATSLMPPLCTAGYGLATHQSQFFFGALYLFLINAIFIFFSSWIVIKLIGYKHTLTIDSKRSKWIQIIVYSLVSTTILVSSYLTFNLIQKNNFINSAQAFVKDQMIFPNTQVLSHNEYIKQGVRHIDVTLIGESLPKDSLQVAMIAKLDSIGLGGTVLNIKQGFTMSNYTFDQEKSFHQFYSYMQKQIDTQTHIIDSLKQITTSYDRSQKLLHEISPEIQVLFPSIERLALAKTHIDNVGTDTNNVDTLNIIFIQAPEGISNDQVNKLKEYIPLRMKYQNPHIIINPKDFPWQKN